MIYLNGKPINVTMFPDNTSQVWKISNLYRISDALIEWKYENEGEIMHLFQLKELLDRLQIEDIHLTIKYLPYARQDKCVDNESTFALTVFSRLLNNMEFSSVSMLDPHSQRAIDLISRSFAVYPKSALEKAVKQTKADIICYPDKGAKEKYSKIYDYEYVSGEKIRNQATGRITSYKFDAELDGDRVLIVDDICDGGATFILLAKELLAAGAKKVNLFVSHGLFTKGTRILHEAGIKRIFTPDGEVHPRKATVQL